ncbi:hypothetical protein TrLO_g15119 [Triparma laevis f. longispina]|uniref:Uncharacterized protein n=1 Tax=Triparma laevis f. longispina TaxID=1714387 RepID=A0A9W7CFP8_9STRA|nr:hypothetical protein TrLO_g15119 [Triparma laevis f. longispina]
MHRKRGVSPPRQFSTGRSSRSSASKNAPASSNTVTPPNSSPAALYKLALGLFILVPTLLLLALRSNNVSHATNLRHVKHRDNSDPQVFVYVNYGSQFPAWPTKLSLKTLRETGGWKGDVVVVTDKEGEFAGEDCEVVLIKEGAVGKEVKGKLLDLIDEKYENVVYLDSDIIVSKPFAVEGNRNYKSIFNDLSDAIHQIGVGESHIAMFKDSAGHMVGWCSGCDVWHTGVIGLKRGRSDGLLGDWSDKIEEYLGGVGGEVSDQSAIDSILDSNARYKVSVLPYKRLMFMKDTLRLAKDQISPELDVGLEHYTGLQGGEGAGGGGGGLLYDYRSIMFSRNGIDIGAWIGGGG